MNYDYQTGGPVNRAVAPELDRYGIVVPETNPREPSKEWEKMARRRFQNPEPQKRGNSWCILVWQDEFINGRRERTRKRITLASAETPKREVEKLAAEALRPMNQGLITVGSAVKFADYIEQVYRPTELPLLAKSTQQRTNSVIENHLKPKFAESCLRDVTPLEVQRYFSGMTGADLSHESQDKIRDVLSAILGSAIRYGYLVKNPAEGIRLLRAGVNRSKPYVTPQQFASLLHLMPEPYSSMVYVAAHTGLRASELIGLRWRNVHADSITVEERCWRGDWGAPKSKASRATVPVNQAVIGRIHRLKTVMVEMRAGRAVRRYPAVKSEGPDDLVFQSPLRGGPMRDNNVLVRFIKPAARQLGIPWVNWQVLRRSFATWLKMAGADVKDAQGLMRHSRASTTLDIYQQFVPESQRRAVERLAELPGSILVN